MRRTWFLPVALAALNAAAAPGINPETGSYVFRYYSADVYGASPQNWGAAQGPGGLLYFANTDGLLEFDGLVWRLTRLPGNPAVKSVAVDAAGTVYVGAQGDFGFLRADRFGTLRFISLLDKAAAADRKFADVWRILPTPEGVYFSSYARLFRLGSDGSLHVWRPVSNFGRAFSAWGGIFVKTPERGLLRVAGDGLVPVEGGDVFTKLGIPDSSSRPDSALIATPTKLYRLNKAGGVEPFPTSADDWFAKNLIYTVRVLANGEIAAGTRNGGLALIAPDGHADRFLSKANGLPDDYVTAIFEDKQGGVWLTGNNGIARFNPGLSRFEGAAAPDGDVQSIARLDGTVYAGTSKGLFRMAIAAAGAPPFTGVQGIDAKVWPVQPFGQALLAATDAGVFLVSGTAAKPVFDSARPRVQYEVSPSAREPGVFYAAGRAGVFKLRPEGSKWLVAGEFSVAGQEFRSVLEDADGRVWAASREGLWRIDFTQTPARAEKFADKEGAPAGWKNVRRFGGHVVFATARGLRRFAEDRKALVPDNSLGAQFADGSRDVFDIFPDTDGNVWVTGDKYHGLLLRQSNGQYRWKPSPLGAAGIREIYGASVDPDGTIWLVGDKGVLHRFERRIAGDPDAGFSVLTRRVVVNGSREIYGGGGAFGSPSLPWGQNALRFEFAAPFFEEPEAVEFQVQLEGSDRGWSAWSRESRRDYTHLPEGSYRFRVRARSPHGAVAEDSSVAFDVLPPWYRTWWAYGVYAICGGFFVWGVVRLRTRQLEREKEQLEEIVQERTVEIRAQRDQIHAEERKSHSLLLNILPAAVAGELKSTGAVRPVGFDEVTVCFTDFVGFTLSSEKLAPGKLVDALNEYFTAFDDIVARYGLEKLKTIGDSYMFASGLPSPRQSHAVDAVLAALEMVEVVRRLADKVDGTGWNIRVGLHSGPVVAGVVGTRKFAFDIWGNTVNFAARMESSGVPGRVNMSEKTFRSLRGLVACQARGEVKIKEGRELPMFLAEGPVADFDRRYREEFGEEPKAQPAAEAYRVEAASPV